MTDPFLQKTGVYTEASAMSNAIQAALQRNKTYATGCSDDNRSKFRTALAIAIREEAQRYTQPVADAQHCDAIGRIANGLSRSCGEYLFNRRLRYGTARKAFNLYLKFLWRLGRTAMPPHCPIDNTVLENARINSKWTQCDSEAEYQSWVKRLRTVAKPFSLAEWKDQLWLHKVK
jgi:hypothetical protein